MPTAIILGSGMVGSVMAADLARDFDTTIADRSDEALARAKVRTPSITTVKADLTDHAALRKLIAPFDIVLGALASRIGYQTLRTVIEAGKHYVDISFMPEDALELDALAKQHNVTAVPDCGVAPGMSNMLAGYAYAQLDETHRIDIVVGGLPRERAWPFEYKAGFSPHDVIEEYTRPARLVEHSRIVVREALSEPELIHFRGLGTLEAFNTDGLRSLMHTLNPSPPFMRERTMRYPGHAEIMRIFRETGLFSTQPINLGNAEVRPIDLTSALLFPKWTYDDDEEDMTVMRVVVDGRKNNSPMRCQWDLHDTFDRATKTTSMARTTAFPATIIARRILSGRIAQRGVIPPEHIGAMPGELEHVLREHEKRGVRYTGYNAD